MMTKKGKYDWWREYKKRREVWDPDYKAKVHKVRGGDKLSQGPKLLWCVGMPDSSLPNTMPLVGSKDEPIRDSSSIR
jgi:hypothetical protein